MPSKRKDPDAWITAISKAMKVTPEELATMSIDDIKEKGQLNQRDAYEARRTASANIAAEGADDSLSKKILKILKNGPQPDISGIRSALFFQYENIDASNTDIAKAVWSLQKRSLVTFYERKHGTDSILGQIKLSRTGLKEMGVIPTPEMTRPSKVKPSRELKRPSQVGRDMTEAKLHGYAAKGDPVEVVNPAKPAPEVVPSVPYIPQDRGWKNASSPPPQNTKSLTNGHFDAAQFPAIAAVLDKADRRAAFQMAAEALDGVDDNTAKELRDRLTFTPLEEEVAMLIHRRT